MTQLERINGRGMAGSWAAEMLAADCKRKGVTMANEFAYRVRFSAAFNVPAVAIKADSKWITYQFKDGSTAKFPNQHYKG